MIPSESEILYRGTAAGMVERRPPLKCISCKTIIEPEQGGLCEECRDGYRQRVTPSSTLCRGDHHDECNGRYAVHYSCGCRCHGEVAA